MYYTAPKGLSNRDQSHIEQAKTIASFSTCRNKHGAIIIKGGRVLAVGTNRFKNHPNVVSRPWVDSSTHAEIAALKTLGYQAKGCIIYIARVNSTGKPMMSKPCDSCMEALKKAGVKKIYYTIDKEIDL